MLRKRLHVFVETFIKVNEGGDNDKIFECLSVPKKKNLTFKDKLNEEYKNIDKSFEQNYCSRTAISLDRVGHISTGSMKRWHKIKDIMKT